MRQRSFEVAGYWAVLVVACLLGNVVTFWGFGSASERLNKRVRDASFSSLMRQEVGFFDKRNVGTITSQLQDDAARIHAFSGEPIRSLIIAISSSITGIVISLVVSRSTIKRCIDYLLIIYRSLFPSLHDSVHVAIRACRHCLHTNYDSCHQR